MRNRLRSILETAAWLVPALVLAFSGVAKLVSPHGAVPSTLARFTAFVPYSVLLRLLGAFELLVTGHIVVPGTRRRGAIAAFGLLSAFALLIAANAYDQDFLSNCGCFGGLEVASGFGPLSGAGAMLVRNALLCGLLAVSLFAGSAVRARTSWGVGLGAAALVFFATGYLAELRLGQHDRATNAVLEDARERAMFRLPPPPIRLVAANGDTTTSDRALRAGDHVIFFSPGCPHCRDQAPAWAPFARAVEAHGDRLVLFAVGDSTGVRAFKHEFGLDSLASYSVPGPLDPTRWAIDAIPRMVVIGPGGRLAYHEQQRMGAGLMGSVAFAGSRVGGLEADAWNRVAVALTGPGTVLETTETRGDLRIAHGRTRRGEPVVICAGQVFGAPTQTIELAIGLDARRRIIGIVPLSLTGYAHVVDPDGRSLESLAGLDLDEAVKEAQRRAGETTMEAPMWSPVGVLLGAMADALPAAPGKP